MSLRCTLLACLLLAACGGGRDDDNNNHGYGDSFDAQGASGLRLRYTPVLTPDDPMARVSLYETEFADVQRCTALAAPAPFVIVVPDGVLPDGLAGRYLNRPSLILLGQASVSVFRHEAIHYLLDVATGDLDPGHRSELFTRCAPGEIRLLADNR